MARAKTTKKSTSKITKKAEARIVELSLQNPDFGAKRLVPLLKQKKIRVSASQIYSVLKRHDLQTRDKRLARAEKQAPKKSTSKPAQSPTKMTDATEEQIVAASLQNPDFGAKRLVSLLKERAVSVSASAVYAILKRHGLQNRAARLKRLKDEGVKPDQGRKAQSADVTPEVEERIVEIALQHPDFGAKRLLPLLLERGIDVSSSKVYRILKQRGLQTRQLRQARLEDQRAAEETPLPEKAPAVTDMTPEIESRIVDLSLQNPDQGPRRLAGLLEVEGIVIASSAIYSLLKRHGLQTRELRQSRIELERLTEDDSTTEEADASGAVLLPAAAGEPEPAITETVDVPETRPVTPAAAVAVKSHRGARWLFYVTDVLLLLLLLYLGYLGYHAVIDFKQTRSRPEIVAQVKPESEQRAEQTPKAIEPLDGYRKIWERNLFNIPEKTAPAAKPEVPIENIALAKKSIGLKLVGTVVANDDSYSRAIVHVTKTREQDAYRVGDQAGKAKIKKILRNKVIITTDKGDLLLTIDDEDFGKGRKASSTQRRAASSLASPQRGPGTVGYDSSVMQLPRRGVRSININQEEVAAALADTDQLLEELSITPFMQDDQPAGFIISKIPRGSVLTKMGLRNGYVVTQINDTAITGPEQASDFFKTLADGGEVTIQVQRSRGVRRRPRQINLNIE